MRSWRTRVIAILATVVAGCGSDAQDISQLSGGSGGGDAGSSDGETTLGTGTASLGGGSDSGGPAIDTDTDTAGDATTGPPLEPGLLQVDDFAFSGAFRIPADNFGASNANFSQGPIEVDPAQGSVFVVGHTQVQAVAEFAMPQPVNSAVLAELPMADAPIQDFATVLDRASGGNPQSINVIAGMRVVNDGGQRALIVNGYEYYDAPGDNTATTVIVRDASDLAGSTVDGFFAFSGAAHASGWISPIPDAWQDVLGGATLTGSASGVPIISRLSVGPSAFVFDLGEIAQPGSNPGSVATAALLDYSLNTPLNEDLYNEAGDNDVWTHLSRANYGFIVPGTRTYATFGSSGGHGDNGICYKCVPLGEKANCGGYCSVDPDDYDTFYWFYDVEDLAAVGDGATAPHELRPYAWGPFPQPFGTRDIGGGAYDPETGLLYLTMQRADNEQGTYANPPVVAAFSIASDG